MSHGAGQHVVIESPSRRLEQPAVAVALKKVVVARVGVRRGGDPHDGPRGGCRLRVPTVVTRASRLPSAREPKVLLIDESEPFRVARDRGVTGARSPSVV